MIGQRRALMAAQRAKNTTRHVIERVKAERSAEGLIPQTHENYRYRHFLLPAYLDYVANVSWADHAISLQSAAVLAQLCDVHQPQRVLDTGSGFSSYVLRRYAAETGAQVVSVDDDTEWMAKTSDYLTRHGMDAQGQLVGWDAFKVSDPEPFGLVFHDLGTYSTRVKTMEQVAKLRSPGGLCIFDDVHVSSVRRKALEVCRASGWDYFSMRGVTLDEIQRYSGLGT